MNNKSLFLIIIFFFLSLFGFSQDRNQELLFKIIDKTENYPVAYATVQFKLSPNGIIASENGEFRVPFRYKTVKDTLAITSIGYKTVYFSLENSNIRDVNVILMEQQTEELDQVVITTKNKKSGFGLGANAIVKKAIDKIPLNYPAKPFSYISYYRDYQLISNTYYNLTEGIIESFDQGFQTNKIKFYKNRDAIYSYRLNEEFAIDSLISSSVYNDTKEIKDAQMSNNLDNELSLLNIHDAVRNYDRPSFSFINIFKDNFIDNHDFSRGRLTYLDDEPIYQIKFIAKDKATNKKFEAKGKIFISKFDYSIHKLNYSLYKRGDDTPIFQVNIEYKKVNNKMYLNYITFNNAFVIKQKDGLKVKKVDFDSKEKSFYLTFNNIIDEKSIKRKSNYKLYYKGQKMIIIKVNLYSPKVIKVVLGNWNTSVIDDSQIKMTDFSYKLKRIKDKSGFEINKLVKLSGYQFREMYVQKVNIDKLADENLIFIQKDKPLNRTRVNENIEIDDFWLNSPLKTTKN